MKVDLFAIEKLLTCGIWHFREGLCHMPHGECLFHHKVKKIPKNIETDFVSPVYKPGARILKK